MGTELLTEKEKLLYRLRGMYRGFGYRPFRMSKFEKYELYAGNKDFLESDRVITFYDTDGELMALKPDVTLSIVRNAEYRPGRKEKYFYQENVYRPAGNGRQFREIMQCGLECIGDLDCYDEYEVLRLAERSLRMTERECILSFSHLGIMKSLMDALGADENTRQDLRKLISARNGHELRDLFRDRGWDPAMLEDLHTLLALSCDVAELPEHLRSFAWMDGEVLREMEELSRLFEGGESVAEFDFSVSGDLHYYNGLVFQGFVYGVSEKILSGGRYDRLLARMGKPGGAIGFAVYFGLLDQLGSETDRYDADVLLLYDEATPLAVLRDRVSSLEAEGLSVSAQRCEGGNYRTVEDMRGGGRNA